MEKSLLSNTVEIELPVGVQIKIDTYCIFYAQINSE